MDNEYLQRLRRLLGPNEQFPDDPCGDRDSGEHDCVQVNRYLAQTAQQINPIAVQTKDLAKKYGDQQAVDNLSLEVSAGQIYGFLGPNGAGKTTTVDILCGARQADDGRAVVAGVDVGEDPEEVKRRATSTTTPPAVFSKLTVREFLLMYGELHEVAQDEAERRARELLELFRLTEKENELAESLSSGEGQKCALAGALLPAPQIIFLDEPTAVLDPATTKMLEELLRHFVRTGRTVFLTTHELRTAESICDQMAIINDGALVRQGTFQQLQQAAHPQPNENLHEIFISLTRSGIAYDPPLSFLDQSEDAVEDDESSEDHNEHEPTE